MSNRPEHHRRFPKIVDENSFRMTDAADPLRRYGHLIVLVVASALFTLVVSCWIWGGPIEILVWAGPCLFILLASTIIIVAIWSAFGPGRYLRRLLWSHGLGAVVGFAFFVAPIAYADGPTELWSSLTNAILVASVIPASSLAAQIPFLFFRVILGWQFVFRDKRPVEPIALRDVFSFMFVMAIGLTAPQLAWSINEDANRVELQSFALIFLAWLTAISCCAALLALPIFLAVFRSNTLPIGLQIARGMIHCRTWF